MRKTQAKRTKTPEAEAVALSAHGAGAASFTILPTATTDGAGAFTTTVSPSKNTTYEASFAGAASAHQVKTRSGWKRFARAKITKKSSFTLLRRPAGHKKYRFRASTSGDAQHLAGKSRIVTRKT